MKPIHFPPAVADDVVRIFQTNLNKTVMRWAVKPQPAHVDDIIYKNQECEEWFISPDNDCFSEIKVKPPYKTGDILYVQETFWKDTVGKYYYKADDNLVFFEDDIGFGFGWHHPKWRPSIHMPREAARIFLRVTGVRVERLRDIFNDPPGPTNQIVREGCAYGCDYIALWQNAIKKADRALYGWYANPWVWVVEFERISKEEALQMSA